MTSKLVSSKVGFIFFLLALPVTATQTYYVAGVPPQENGYEPTGIDNSGNFTYAPLTRTPISCPSGFSGNCTVFDTNSLGDEVGNGHDAFLISHTGAVTDLSATVGIISVYGINDEDDIVGTSWFNGSTFSALGGLGFSQVGVLLMQGTSSLIELNAAAGLPDDLGFSNKILNAFDINDHDQIITDGIAGAGIFLLLDPCGAAPCPANSFAALPEPSSLAYVFAGITVLLILARRFRSRTTGVSVR